MSKCVHHPGRSSVVSYNNQDYCAQCQADIAAAAQRVDRHVEPKSCFVWFTGAQGWQPIGGTGCAHWVAHQLGIHSGGRSGQCLEGYTYRVRTLIQGMRPIALENVQVNDVFVTLAQDHTGLVVRVAPNPLPKKPRVIMIRHDSSNQGRVADNDFAGYFHGHGSFYR
jgi:hypothetical protein